MCRTPADLHVRVLQGGERERQTSQEISRNWKRAAADGFVAVKLTGALWKVGDVLVVEEHLVLQHVGQPSKPRATHDAHYGSDIRLGHQPIGSGLAFLVAVSG